MSDLYSTVPESTYCTMKRRRQHIYRCLVLLVIAAAVFMILYIDHQSSRWHWTALNLGSECDVCPETRQQYQHSYAILTNHAEKCGQIIKPTKISYVNETQETWQQVLHSKSAIMLYGAYYDNRRGVGTLPIIRISALARPIKEKRPIFCQVWYSSIKTPVVSEVHAAEFGLVKHDKGLYMKYVFSCALKVALPPPTGVSIVTANCEQPTTYLPLLIPNSGDEHTLGVCVPITPTSQGASTHELIEWTELHWRFGVGHFHFYSSYMDEKQKAVLNSYVHEQNAVLTDIQNPLPFIIRGSQVDMDVVNFAATFDCFMRNIYNYKLLTILDISEIFVPQTKDFLTHLFSFDEAKRNLYSKYKVTKKYFNSKNVDLKKHLTELKTMIYKSAVTIPNSELFPIFDPYNCKFMNGSTCVEYFVAPNSSKIDPNLATIHVYSTCPYDTNKCKMYDEESKIDSTLDKFNSMLLQRVKDRFDIVQLENV